MMIKRKLEKTASSREIEIMLWHHRPGLKTHAGQPVTFLFSQDSNAKPRIRCEASQHLHGAVPEGSQGLATLHFTPTACNGSLTFGQTKQRQLPVQDSPRKTLCAMQIRLGSSFTNCQGSHTKAAKVSAKIFG